MKNCKKCNLTLDKSEFYAHSKMSDGLLNVCKLCVKKRVSERYKDKIKDPSFLESERERQRDKYHRLYNDGRHNPSHEKKKEIIKRYKEKYPEKIEAKNKTSHMRAKEKGHELHHWSYNKEHLKDVIELSVSDHNTIHRFLDYDQDKKMYRRTDNGVLLDTREASEIYYKEILTTNK